MTHGTSTTDRGTESVTVTVVGDARQRLDEARLDTFSQVERVVTVACASGERTTARWTGITLPDLLERADAPPETTHVRVDGGDGYRVCVPVRAALDGLLATHRDGERLASIEPYATRFVAPDVDGTRMAKGVRQIETVVLDDGADPEALERLDLDDPSYGEKR